MKRVSFELVVRPLDYYWFAVWYHQTWMHLM